MIFFEYLNEILKTKMNTTPYEGQNFLKKIPLSIRFYYIKWGERGTESHRLVTLMLDRPVYKIPSCRSQPPGTGIYLDNMSLKELK